MMETTDKFQLRLKNDKQFAEEYKYHCQVINEVLEDENDRLSQKDK